MPAKGIAKKGGRLPGLLKRLALLPTTLLLRLSTPTPERRKRLFRPTVAFSHGFDVATQPFYAVAV